MEAGPHDDVPALGSWERYKLIADNSGDVVYQTTTDGRIQWVQPTVTALLGFDPGYLVGLEARSLVHPDDTEMVSRLRLRVYDGAALDEIPCRFRTVDGGYRSCTVRARPVHAPDGTIVGAVMTLRDVSERIAALRALATLSRAGSVLVRSRDRRTLLEGTCRTIVEAGQYRFAWYVRPDAHDPEHLVAVASSDGADPWITALVDDDGVGIPDAGPAGQCMRLREPVLVPDIADDASFDRWRSLLDRHQVRSALALPVIVEGDVDGALVVYASEAHAFDRDAEDLLADLAANVAYGIGRLHDAATSDLLHSQTEAQRRRLQATLDSLFEPLAILETRRDDEGRAVDLVYVEANEAAVRYHRRPREATIGHSMLEIYPNLMNDGPLALYLRCADTGEPVVLDDYAFDNQVVGEERRYDLRAVQSGDGIVLTWRDVTDRWRDRQRVASDERQYRLIAEHGTDILWEVDENGAIRWVSASITRVLGWSRDEVVGRSSVELVHPDDSQRASASRARVIAGETGGGELRILQSDGGYRWMSLTAHPLPGESHQGGFASLRDIDDEVRGRDVLEHAVRHDPITGAPTRAVLASRLQEELDAGRPGVVALLCADIDRLSAVNESLSYDAGDRVLAEMADRIARVVDDWDLVGRGSGDELLVFLPGLAEPDEAEHVAERIRDAAREPIAVDGRHVRVTVSIGIATSTLAPSAEQLLRDAGVALRQAQDLGGDRASYVDPQLAAYAARRLSLEQDIRDGLLAGGFQAWLQPIVSLTTGDVRGYEALVRWMRPDGTVVPPDAFLPTAERTGLVVDLDLAVLDGALGALPHLVTGSTVAVNLSAASLRSEGLADAVLGALARHGVDPRRLHLEVIETALLDDLTTVRAHMARLAEAGVLWYVDDFGTGYSSISHLRDLPIAGVKLDRSFTFGVADGDQRCIELSKALVGLADGLGLDGVAEGIETEAVARTLAAHGWQHGQGWLFGRPSPAPTD